MGGKKKRKRWVDSDSGDFLEWDYQHGKIERYNDNGKHIGEYDPETGQETKPPNRNRTITPTIGKSMRFDIIYYLTWFEKKGDDFVDESLLVGVDEMEVRRIFKLEPDEPPGDCIEVDSKELEWLEKVASNVNIRLDLFDYFVEACKP